MLACLGALLVIFCMWWIYFEEEGVAHRLNNYKTAFYWGYGHYFVFASAAAAGAGLAAQVDFRLGHAQGLSAGGSGCVDHAVVHRCAEHRHRLDFGVGVDGADVVGLAEIVGLRQ